MISTCTSLNPRRRSHGYSSLAKFPRAAESPTRMPWGRSGSTYLSGVLKM